MRAMRITLAVAAFAALSSMSPASASTLYTPAPARFEGTCQEQCGYDCAQYYPDDAWMRTLCTSGCIESVCGGGPYP